LTTLHGPVDEKEAAAAALTKLTVLARLGVGVVTAKPQISASTKPTLLSLKRIFASLRLPLPAPAEQTQAAEHGGEEW
jgi:hypothetical protein